MTQPRDNAKDAETIEILRARVHAIIRAHALGKDPSDGGYLPIEHLYARSDGVTYCVQDTRAVWPKQLRSQVVFSAADDDEHMRYTLSISKWVSLGFEAILDEFDFYRFRGHVCVNNEELHLDMCKLKQSLNLGDDRVSIERVPEIVDATVALTNFDRDAILNFAAQSLGTATRTRASLDGSAARVSTKAG